MNWYACRYARVHAGVWMCVGLAVGECTVIYLFMVVCGFTYFLKGRCLRFGGLYKRWKILFCLSPKWWLTTSRSWEYATSATCNPSWKYGCAYKSLLPTMDHGASVSSGRVCRRSKRVKAKVPFSILPECLRKFPTRNLVEAFHQASHLTSSISGIVTSKSSKLRLRINAVHNTPKKVYRHVLEYKQVFLIHVKMTPTFTAPISHAYLRPSLASPPSVRIHIHAQHVKKNYKCPLRLEQFSYKNHQTTSRNATRWQNKSSQLLLCSVLFRLVICKYGLVFIAFWRSKSTTNMKMTWRWTLFL